MANAGEMEFSRFLPVNDSGQMVAKKRNLLAFVIGILEMSPFSVSTQKGSASSKGLSRSRMMDSVSSKLSRVIHSPDLMACVSTPSLHCNVLGSIWPTSSEGSVSGVRQKLFDLMLNNLATILISLDLPLPTFPMRRIGSNRNTARMTESKAFVILGDNMSGELTGQEV